jgi:hypothetical protein
MTLFALDGALDWNLTRRENLTSAELGYIPPRDYQVNSPNLIIGVGINEGRPTWEWAGKLIQYVPALPDSGAIFPPKIEVARYPIYIGQYTHLKLAEYSPRPYDIRLKFPRWLIDATVELWWYDES